MWKEFRDFAMRGNVIDLAIGVIIGAAFGKIIDSLVNDVIMPVIGAVTGGLDFSNYFTPLSHNVTSHVLVDAKRQGAVLAWGNFATIVLNFLIVAFVLFLVVRAINMLQQQNARGGRGAAATPGSPARRDPGSSRQASEIAQAEDPRSWKRREGNVVSDRCRRAPADRCHPGCG